MSKKTSNGHNRRKVLKAISGGLGAITLTSSAVAADSVTGKDVLDVAEVSTVLAAAGNPKVLNAVTETVTVPGNGSFEKTEVKTEIGTLTYSRFTDDFIQRAGLDAEGDNTAVQFMFDELSAGDRRLPERFRSLPASIELGLFYEGGEVVARRTATKSEVKRLASIAGVSLKKLEDAGPVYDETAGVYLFPSEDGLAHVYLDEAYPVGRHEAASRSLDAGEFRIDIETTGESNDSVSASDWEGADCWGGWGSPCVQCVFGSGVCGVCAAGCSLTGGVGCIACIAGCAGAGGSCGCCLSCDSNVHNPICY